MKPVAHGIYDALIDEYLRDALTRHPELRTVFGKIDPEEQPTRHASFVELQRARDPQAASLL